VILVDVNLLVYAHDAGAKQHDRARAWLDERLGGAARVGLPWESLVGFVRVVSNRRIYARPESVLSAWSQVQEWLSCSSAWLPVPTEFHAEAFSRTLRASAVASRHVHDAHLAALAIEHGLTLCSADGDFARFDGLRWENPLR
jgi:toxin-antitoxin system PIN domain toxin